MTLEKTILISHNTTLKKSLVMFFVIILFSSSVPMINFSNPSAMFDGTDVILPEAYAEVVPVSWFDDSWSFRQAITMDESKVNGTANFTNFPVLISISDSADLKNTNVQSNGEDIRFTTSDGTTELSYELESFSNNVTTGTIIAWINLPVLDFDDDTILYMYYGNSQVTDNQNSDSVWNDSYTSVYHMSNSTLDSTINNLNRFSINDVSSVIGNGLEFTGSDTSYAILHPHSQFPSTTLSTEFWLNTTGTDQGILSYASSGDNTFLLFNRMYQAL